MANEAHKEPTMEEILASIRKIISDDEASPAAATPVQPVEPSAESSEEESFESLELADADESVDEDMFGDEEDAFEAEFDSFETEDDDPVGDAPSFEEMLGAARAVADQPEESEAEAPEARFEPEPRPDFKPEPEPAAPAPEPVAASVEEDMASSARYQQTTLTDDQTADAAAGALGKLISKMDMGGDNTIEGLVRELLKPMIKEWLDANLPKIVEEKVEAEVQRIARMAR